MYVKSIMHGFLITFKNVSLCGLLVAIIITTYRTPINHNTLKVIASITLVGMAYALITGLIFAGYRAVRIHWGIDELRK